MENSSWPVCAGETVAYCDPAQNKQIFFFLKKWMDRKFFFNTILKWMKNCLPKNFLNDCFSDVVSKQLCV